MSSILVPTGLTVILLNDLDYGTNEMIAPVDETFNCVGSTKFNHASF
jgi:hypothetical protein